MRVRRWMRFNIRRSALASRCAGFFRTHRLMGGCDPARMIRRQTSNYIRHVVASVTQAGPLGDDAQIAKSGELPPKALVRVDAIRKACLTNLDGALDCLFTEVEHPVYERPVCNLLVGRGMQAIAGNQ